MGPSGFPSGIFQQECCVTEKTEGVNHTKHIQDHVGEYQYVLVHIPKTHRYIHIDNYHLMNKARMSSSNLQGICCRRGTGRDGSNAMRQDFGS